MEFQQRKIHTETLSEYLVAVRQSHSLSLGQVAEKTGISVKFLQNLEQGFFKVLPPDVYVYGFLRKLAVLYSIDQQELINQYKKEKGIDLHLQKSRGLAALPWYKNFLGNFTLTPKLITLFCGLLFIVATVSYIVWQVWSINRVPFLTLAQPQDNAVLSSPAAQVVGQTDAGMSVTVNGQDIFVDPTGGFNSQIVLSPGPSQITVAASNRFGKTVTKTISVIANASSTPTTMPLSLKVNFSGSVSLGVIIDNQSQQQLNFSAGDSKVFAASQEITLSTSDAGATKVSLNGQNLGVMGKAKEHLSGVSFYAQPQPSPSLNFSPTPSS